MLTRLKAHNFRNLEPLDWSPGRGRHLLFGGNGAGKTSVLESIYVLATTRSFRAPRLEICVRHGAEFLRLEGEVEEERRWHLELVWSRAEGLVRRVDGSASTLAGHLAVLPVVAWTAAEAEVVTGEPGHRRRFMDRGVVGVRPAALESLSRYRQALDQKRELLSGEGGAGPLAPWNDLLAEAAAEVVRARRGYVERLAAALEEIQAAADLPVPDISLAYRPSPKGALEGREAIRESLERVADRERELGFALVGPQRDDLEILWGGRPVGSVASAGERKALSLLLVAAHGRVLETAGRIPVYLLDDADAELAPDTLERLWQTFAGARQLMASSNRPAVWKGLGREGSWKIEEGRLVPD